MNSNYTFLLSPHPLTFQDLTAGLATPASGAFVSFEGLVRNHNNDKSVVALEYEAFSALCEKEAEKIFVEAEQKGTFTAIKCAHRVGKLSVGELAVWVGVCAAHRDPAFQACRYVIDQIKARLPIWKKEYYQDGDSGWINCQLDNTVRVKPISNPRMT